MRKIFFAIATITLVSFYSCESKKTVQETIKTVEKKSVNQDTLSAQKTAIQYYKIMVKKKQLL